MNRFIIRNINKHYKRKISTNSLLKRNHNNNLHFLKKRFHNSTKNNVENVAINESGKKSGGGGAGKTVGIVVFSGIVCATAGLGSWQIKRYYWKKDLVDERRKTLLSKPMEIHTLPKTSDEVKEYEYRPITIKGTFDHENEILVGPRSPPKDRTGGMGLADVKGETAGFYVVTPFILKSKGNDGTHTQKILVNRGWIPGSFAAKEKSDYAITESAKRYVEGIVEVVGILTPGEEKNTFSPPNDIKNRRFLWFEMDGLTQASSYLDPTEEATSIGIIQATESHNNGTFPMQRPIEAYNDFYTTTNTHLIYAGTWFTLATAGTFMTYRLFR